MARRSSGGGQRNHGEVVVVRQPWHKTISKAEWECLSDDQRRDALTVVIGEWHGGMMRLGCAPAALTFIDARRTETFVKDDGTTFEARVGHFLGWETRTKEERENFADAADRFLEAAHGANALEFDYRAEIVRHADDERFTHDAGLERGVTDLAPRYEALHKAITKALRFRINADKTAGDLLIYRDLTAESLAAGEVRMPAEWLAGDLHQKALSLARLGHLFADLARLRHQGPRSTGDKANTATRELLTFAGRIGMTQTSLADAVVKRLESGIDRLFRLSLDGLDPTEVREIRVGKVFAHFKNIANSRSGK